MSLDRNALDQWITREPPEDETEPACKACGAELSEHAERITIKRELLRCDGQPVTVQSTYSDSEIVILGPEYAGLTYALELPATCGDYSEHPAHELEVYAERTEIRTCACGTEDRQVLV